MNHQWVFRARPASVVDGDTLDVVVDIGFRITRQVRVRLEGVDTHEVYGVEQGSTEHQKGEAEAEFVKSWLSAASDLHSGDWPLLVRTSQQGKYGRYIATVERRADGKRLAGALKSEFDGIAVDE